MSTRSGQSGTVVRKGLMWHGRYYADVAGQNERRRASVPIGPIKEMTKTEAKRKLRSMLEQMGLNANDHLVRLDLGGHLKTGHLWSVQNRPLGVSQT